MKTLMNRQEAAALLKVSTRTLARWSEAGTLRAVRVGPRLVRYEEEELQRFLQRSGVESEGGAR